MLLDVKEIQAKARAELAEEVTEEAVVKLKELYTKLAKAEQIAKNIKREIDGYLANIEENAVYKAAGVDAAT
jgi:flagellar biosynthesis chaperone FliJ